MYTCTHWNSADVPGFFFSDGALCFFLIFCVILLACRVSVCACMHVHMCSHKCGIPGYFNFFWLIYCRKSYVLPKPSRCTFVRGLGKILWSNTSGYIVGTYIISD